MKIFLELEFDFLLRVMVGGILGGFSDKHKVTDKAKNNHQYI